MSPIFFGEKQITKTLIKEKVMKIQSTTTQQNTKYHTTFKGPLDGILTKSLMLIDTNPMVNAAAVDVGFMVLPRTAIDTKKRNKFAGFETFFRELTGTIIMCFSAGPVSYLMAKLYNKVIDKDTNISPKNWATNQTFDVLKEAYIGNEDDVKSYVNKTFSNISGVQGRGVSKWKEIEWDKVEWFDDPAWKKYNWKNPKWKNVINESKNEEQIIHILTDLIKTKDADSKDIKQAFKIIEHRIANALKVSNSVDVKIGDKNLSATLKNIIRDAYDLGKNIFYNNIDLKKAESKIKSMNRFKSLSAVAIVATIGLTNQYVNRLITKKRTGKDDFVGEENYEKTSSDNKNISNTKIGKARLLGLKILASAGIFALSMKVMNIKSLKDFVNKLEFTSAITSGNAIKTLYTATLIGRFFASRREKELRESSTRDYFGFLNWLVLGGFVSKGVAKFVFDRKQEILFNVSEDGSKKWLKSHAEIAALGKDFAKKHMWKINLSHLSGLLYSGLALGCALPLLNIFISKRKSKIQESKKVEPNYSNLLNFRNKKEIFSVFQ